MTSTLASDRIKMAFEAETLLVSIADIRFLRPVRPDLKTTRKYRQIATSIREVGIIEAPSSRAPAVAIASICFSTVTSGSKCLKTLAKPTSGAFSPRTMRP
jgi:hypothetical protein